MAAAENSELVRPCQSLFLPFAISSNNNNHRNHGAHGANRHHLVISDLLFTNNRHCLNLISFVYDTLRYFRQRAFCLKACISSQSSLQAFLGIKMSEFIGFVLYGHKVLTDC